MNIGNGAAAEQQKSVPTPPTMPPTCLPAVAFGNCLAINILQHLTSHLQYIFGLQYNWLRSHCFMHNTTITVSSRASLPRSWC